MSITPINPHTKKGIVHMLLCNGPISYQEIASLLSVTIDAARLLIHDVRQHGQAVLCKTNEAGDVIGYYIQNDEEAETALADMCLCVRGMVADAVKSLPTNAREHISLLDLENACNSVERDLLALFPLEEDDATVE